MSHGFRPLISPPPGIEVAAPDFLSRLPANPKKLWQGFFVGQGYTKDGEPMGEAFCLNGVTNAGIESNENVYFGAATQITTWYLGLINASGFTALSAADTSASHAGWTELTSYDEATRQSWTPGSASGRTITNPVSATFTISATVSIQGAFLISVSTKGGATGVIWATGSFSTAYSLVDDQTFKLTYTLTGTSS